ncbi:NAD-dependent epimerase/dehydratase family protein [Mixta tenebrionis]|uniref:SDR family oxidoreductase n=1 Tax=Mixta tenebrionis TaxID=2562439 RepID=A0A506VB18_9GAMM|nr:NAD-dependent epimerase/dehydratase family protein [Mixta tenebrionis]TPW42702.1 SDR family oxidoreductase [Mixta tenebrionis]
MKILITGADGFIGKNLCLRMAEDKDSELVFFTRHNKIDELSFLLKEVDFIFHLAGVNRPQDAEEFVEHNSELTRILCQEIVKIAKDTGRKIPVLFTSSIHASADTLYGKSKRIAEGYIIDLLKDSNIPAYIYRLPGVFGKWARPNYNSVVATFCNNIARDLPVSINNPQQEISLVYIDDVVNIFISILKQQPLCEINDGFLEVTPTYNTTVGELAEIIQGFKHNRETLIIDRVGSGFIRALYSTFISYLPVEKFTYNIPEYRDPRGAFVEVIKTRDSGQFSYFTAYPGVTRGGHYHHTKTEKFLVIKGIARFRFRHMITGECFEVITNENKAELVETIPGWAHDVTNIGEDELIAIVWANEIFDRSKPDTIASSL